MLSGIVGNEFGDAVGVFVRHAEHSANIAHSDPSLHFSKGNHLRNVIGAVFSRRILNDLIASVIGEINIDIRWCRAVRIEKPLKRQVMLKRVDGGDVQTIRNE